MIYIGSLRVVVVALLAMLLLYYSADNRTDPFIDEANAILPIVLLVILLGTAYARVRKDIYLFWCPLNWFLIGASIAFGFGSMGWQYAEDETVNQLAILYSPTAVEILRTNALNTFAALWIIVGYKIGEFALHRVVSKEIESGFSLHDAERFLRVLLVIFLPFEIFVYLPYLYGFSSWIVPGYLLQLAKLGHVIVFLSAYLWGKALPGYRAYSLVAIFSLFILSVPSFGKGEMLMPFVTATIGYFWATRNFKVLLVGTGTVFALLFSVVGPISGAGRELVSLAGNSNVGFQDRIRMAAPLLTEALLSGGRREADSDPVSEGEALRAFWTRNSFNNVQSYLMSAYDSGNSGDSLKNWFVALVPRAIWPEKPIITDIGFELDILVKNLSETSSSLAPTFNGEAYWNGGWGMVLFISLLIGVQFAHFAVYSKKYLHRGDVRFIFISLFGINFGLTLEAWIVPKYVGGYITIWIMWLVIKVLSSFRTKPLKNGQSTS